MKKAAINNQFLLNLIKKFFFNEENRTEIINFKEKESTEYADYLKYYQQATRWK